MGFVSVFDLGGIILGVVGLLGDGFGVLGFEGVKEVL